MFVGGRLPRGIFCAATTAPSHPQMLSMAMWMALLVAPIQAVVGDMERS